MVDPLGNERLFGFLKTAMDASSAAHEVISGNLANIDTPGYKARRMDFEAVLQDFQDQERMQPPPREHNGQMPPASPLNFKDFVVEEVNDHLVERFDRNNVDLDKEMAVMAKMRGRFQLATQFMNRKIRLMNEVLQSR